MCGPYRRYRVCGFPLPSSGGITVLQMLAMLEPFDVAAMGPATFWSVHFVSEAGRLAYADRSVYEADPAFYTPPAGLLDPAYLRARSALIRPDASLGRAAPGDPPQRPAPARRVAFGADASLELPSTTHLSVVDRDGNAVAMTSTIEDAFGSRLMTQGGFLLNNELTDFSFLPTEDGKPVANRVGAGKRPRSSMAPTIAYDALGRVAIVDRFPRRQCDHQLRGEDARGHHRLEPRSAGGHRPPELRQPQRTDRTGEGHARRGARAEVAGARRRRARDGVHQRHAGHRAHARWLDRAAPIRAAKAWYSGNERRSPRVPSWMMYGVRSVPSDAESRRAQRGRTAMTATTPHRIVIVGGGAGGLPLATKLGDKYGGRDGRALVTLVDCNATHVWKPLLHEVAAGRMDADAHDLDYLAIAHWHGFRFRQGAVSGLDRARREITIDAVVSAEGEEMLPVRVLPYDTLVFCVGSVSNDFGIPGVAQHPISLDTLADAERFHRRLLAVCVRADARAGEGLPAHVNIVIIGAGATGVELAAEIRQTTRAHAGYGLDHLDPAQGHPADADRGVAAHPAAAVRARGRGGDGAPGQARRRRAHGREGHRGARRRRAYGIRRVLSGRPHRVGRRHHGAGVPESTSTASRRTARTSSS